MIGYVRRLRSQYPNPSCHSVTASGLSFKNRTELSIHGTTWSLGKVLVVCFYDANSKCLTCDFHAEGITSIHEFVAWTACAPT
eukprot:s680_g2.t1